MKGFKLLASCAVIGALSAVCAASSMAADYSATATYDAEAGTVSVTASQDYIDLVGAGDFTLLVLSEDATEITNENSDIVKQIQQGDQATVSTVKVGDLADGTYYVRLGGADVSDDNEKGFVATTFTVGTNPDNPYADSTRLIGDTTNDGNVTLGDVVPIVQHSAGVELLTGETLQAADTTDDGNVTLGDVIPVVQYSSGQGGNIDGVKTIAQKSNYVAE